MVDFEDLQTAARRALSIETQEEYEEYQSRLDKLNELVDSLEEDWDYAFEELAFVEDEQFYRRTLTRTLFAMIEGVIFALKQQILEEHRVGRLDLCPAEYAVLAEQSYGLDQKGRLKVSSRYPRLEENVRFTLPMYARARGASSGFATPLDREPRWASFCRAVDIRNRLMHPKSVEDLIVSDSDWEDVQASEKWFVEQRRHLQAIDDEAFRVLLSRIAEQESDKEGEPDTTAGEAA